MLAGESLSGAARSSSVRCSPAARAPRPPAKRCSSCSAHVPQPWHSMARHGTTLPVSLQGRALPWPYSPQPLQLGHQLLTLWPGSPPAPRHPALRWGPPMGACRACCPPAKPGLGPACPSMAQPAWGSSALLPPRTQQHPWTNAVLGPAAQPQCRVRSQRGGEPARWGARGVGSQGFPCRLSLGGPPGPCPGQVRVARRSCVISTVPTRGVWPGTAAAPKPASSTRACPERAGAHRSCRQHPIPRFPGPRERAASVAQCFPAAMGNGRRAPLVSVHPGGQPGSRVQVALAGKPGCHWDTIPFAVPGVGRGCFL